MGLLKEVTPKASRVAVLYNPTDRANVLVLKQLQEAAPALALTLQPLEVRGPGEFDSAFVAMTRERAHALFGASGVLTYEHRKTLGISLPRVGYRRCGAIVRLSRLAVSCLMR